MVYQMDLPHSLGGGVGFFVNEKLNQLIGYLSIFLIVFVGFVFLVLFYQLNPKAPKVQASGPADSSVAGVNPLGMDEDEFVDEGPAIHEDNEDLEVFRPIVPPLKGEEEEIELEPVLAEMPVEAMEEEVLPALEDLDFTV
jgi:hypothetical protein